VSRKSGSTSTKRVAQRLDDLFGAPQTYSIYRNGHLYTRCVLRQSEISSQLIQLRFDAANAHWRIECDTPTAHQLANTTPAVTVNNHCGGNNIGGAERAQLALPAPLPTRQRL
jgi:hypothetical protein